MTRRVVAVAVALALASAACGPESGSSETTATTADGSSSATATTSIEVSTTTAADADITDDLYGNLGADSVEPSTLAITLDEGAAVTVEIGPEGGEVAAGSAAGATFTLSIQPGALFSPTPITMTPVTAAAGAAVGDAPLAMVHLAPEGLTFMVPATLTVTGADIAEPIGIGSGGSGEDAHLLTALAGEDGAVSVEIMHFSAVGISAEAQLADLIRDYRPSGPEALARSVAALNSEDHPTAFAAFEVWAGAVEAGLEAATSTSALEDRTAELLSLVQAVNERMRMAIEVGDRSPTDPPGERLVPVLQGLIDLWFTKVTADVDRLAGLCSKGPSAAFWIYRWVGIGAAVTDLLDLDRESVLRDWETTAVECLVFEVRWDTTVTLKDSEASSTAGGTTTILADEATKRSFDLSVVDLPAIFGEERWKMTSLAFEGCKPVFSDGMAKVLVMPIITLENPGNAQTAEIEYLGVALYPAAAPEVRCQEQLDEGVEVRWGTYLFSSPIGQINSDRASTELGWVFSVAVTSQTGTMGSTTVTESRTESGTTATVEQTVTVTFKGG